MYNTLYILFPHRTSKNCSCHNYNEYYIKMWGDCQNSIFTKKIIESDIHIYVPSIT